MPTSPSRESCKACGVSVPFSGSMSPHVPSPRGLSRRAMLARTIRAAAMAVGPCVEGLSGLAAAGDEDREIWDGHVHLTGLGGTVQQRLNELLQCADRMGIARLVVSGGTSFVENPPPDEVRQRNDEVLKAIELAPRRVLGFVYLNPNHIQESLREMDRCVRDGPMVGVKLWCALRCNRPELDPLVRRAVELEIPILQHTSWRVMGNEPTHSSPSDMVALATRHPDASLICAHSGGDWERGIRELRQAKNVFAEIAGGDPLAGYVEMAVREVGPERVSYGSDAGGRSFASQLAKVMSANVPEEAKRLILGGNLRRLLQRILRQKSA
jgi:uncharacterized protein